MRFRRRRRSFRARRGLRRGAGKRLRKPRGRVRVGYRF